MFSSAWYTIQLALLALLVSACEPQFDHGKIENSPTSGKLNVYYESALEKHVRNQAYTFQRLYPNARLTLFPVSEDLAIKALYDDSCESIVITRPLNEKEIKAFASKHFDPRHSVVATTAMALVCNKKLALKKLSYAEVLSMLTTKTTLKDTAGKEFQPQILLDQSGSGLGRYLLDSLLKSNAYPAHYRLMDSATELLDLIANAEKPYIALLDFAWLSDSDDSLYKTYINKIRLIPIGSKIPNGIYELPNQSSFKLNAYPFARKIFIYRKTGDFTLAKGFESFVAGPKGQTIFLKQGLLPSRQQERSVTVRLEELAD